MDTLRVAIAIINGYETVNHYYTETLGLGVYMQIEHETFSISNYFRYVKWCYPQRHFVHFPAVRCVPQILCPN